MDDDRKRVSKTTSFVEESIYVLKDTVEDLGTSARKKKEIQREYTNMISGLFQAILKHSESSGLSKVLRRSSDRSFVNWFYENFSYRWVGDYALTEESSLEHFIYFTCLLTKLSYENPKNVSDHLSRIFFDQILSNNVNFLHSIESTHESYPMGVWLLQVQNSPLVFLFFKGTGFFDAKSWSTSFDFETIRPFEEDKDLECHKGYYMSLILKGEEEEEKSVYEKIVDFIEENAQKGSKLILCGHSAAGGLASMFGILATIFEEKQLSVEKIFTFGAPRIGNKRFCSILQDRSFRIVHNLDFIPKIPEWLVPHGKTIIVPKKYGLPVKVVKKMQKSLPLISFRLTDHFPGEYFRAIAKFFAFAWKEKKWGKYKKQLKKQELTNEELNKKVIEMEKKMRDLEKKLTKERNERKKMMKDIKELQKLVKKNSKKDSS